MARMASLFFQCLEAAVATRPHDIGDLYLAPVALAVDSGIEELGQLDKDRLAFEVAIRSDTPDFTRSLREEALIRAITHRLDCHDWELSWDPRGIRLTHDGHTFVLGIPAVFGEYLEDITKA
jgi:hypothetical protein